MNVDGLDVDRVLSGLKDFQRRTVDYVFRRMWLDDPPTTRFLVADEVGLGKTLVARGIIAKTLEHLSAGVDRMDIVYVCSNAAIAQQNVNRLNVLGDRHFAMATRLTLLPTQLDELERNRVNFVSFTPGTTFNLRSSGGIWPERVLLHRLLSREFPQLHQPLAHMLCGQVELQRFEQRINSDKAPLNESLAGLFLGRLREEGELLHRVREVCYRFLAPRAAISAEDRALQYALIGDCRHLLARVCVDALEPDLVILDEFQRFSNLLDGDDEAAELARSLMNHTTPEGHRVRVLLLSATPYKPITLGGEEENHYDDFLRTLGFLFDDPLQVARLEEELRIYRRALYQEDDPDLTRARSAVEAILRSVMVRTERVGRTEQRDAMLQTRLAGALLRTEDLDQARLLSEVASCLGAGDTIEYWKSAPHLLHFMKEYQLKRKLVEARDDPPAALMEAIRSRKDRLLSRKQIGGYRTVETGNGRLRVLLDEMVGKGQWQLLWMPPSLPYLEPGGAYAEVPEFTKALVFSSWTVVPDAIAALCSYEVERHMVGEGKDLPHYAKLYDARRPLLRFVESQGRLSGMPTLALMYPSAALAEAVDPLRLSLELGGGRPAPVDAVRRAAASAIEELLVATGMWPRAGDGPADQRWYWAAMALLDWPHLTGRRKWLTSGNGWRGALAGGGDDAGLKHHVELFRAVADGALDEELGPAPDDLLDVLVGLALGSPAICAARALRRVAPELEFGDRIISDAAALVAGGFRTLYNLPETICLLRGDNEDAYWRLTLQHAIDGNLQAVLDEYAHQLRESLGLTDHDDAEVADGVAAAMAEALSLRTAPIAADDIQVGRSGTLRFKRFRFRTRYALRFGDLRDDQDQTLARVGTVRAAFNSPFRPFILATTSVGQEGLDFHPYCHAVYHWNLPSNPVDLEQREGRVHRYKGHAVRKNVAQRWGLETLAEDMDGRADPWEVLFDAAAADRPQHVNDLVPYWIYQIPGGACVERRVPVFPFSRELGKLKQLQQGLALYRLAFGQPRQEDLLSFLVAREERDGHAAAGLDAISLEPPDLGATRPAPPAPAEISRSPAPAA
ncbi:MAG: helicase-related protein [Longimicrobiaceae bacterium]